MDYAITCPCGQSLPVTSTQAGTNIRCQACMQQVSVPLLSELRRSAGRGAYEAGVIDTIQRMINAGELPAGDRCAVSGLPTKDVYDLYVLCESRSMKGPKRSNVFVILMMAFLLPLWWVWLLAAWAWLDEERREIGYDRGITLPLRVHLLHQRKLSKARQRYLKKVLSTVPVYAQLLHEFPRAKVKA